MSHEEVMKMMVLSFAYDHFVEGESPEPPFLGFLYLKADYFAADGDVKAKTGNKTAQATFDRGIRRCICPRCCFGLGAYSWGFLWGIWSCCLLS